MKKLICILPFITACGEYEGHCSIAPMLKHGREQWCLAEVYNNGYVVPQDCFLSREEAEFTAKEKHNCNLIYSK